MRDLVVVASSSRGGSTYLGELLRRAPGTLHLQGETNPIVDAAEGEPDVVGAVLGVEVGRPATEGDGDDVEDTLVWRLQVQWPDLDLDPDQIRSWVRATRAEVPFSAGVAFHLALLRRAGLNPWYYDLPDELVRREFPDIPEPAGPPGETVIEMPPFILTRPWVRATPQELASQPVVLTTPRNSFRLPLLRRIFPNARVRVLHLTRHPAAATNGLVDGWLHRGFFSRQVDGPLRIAGYSDRFPDWGTRWWKFDPFPGWRNWTEAPLEVVCARQWAAPHEAVLADGDDGRCTVRFEDLVGPGRRDALRRIADWMGVPAVADLAGVELPPLMATKPPSPHRWREREGRLLAALRDAGVTALAERLGY